MEDARRTDDCRPDHGLGQLAAIGSLQLLVVVIKFRLFDEFRQKLGLIPYTGLLGGRIPMWGLCCGSL